MGMDLYNSLLAAKLADGGDFSPTTEQLAAMNSGITAEDVTKIGTNENNISTLDDKTTGMSAGGDDYIVVNGVRIYSGANEPTGNIPANSTWIYGGNVKGYHISVNRFNKNIVVNHDNMILNDVGAEVSQSGYGYTNPCATVKPLTTYTITGDITNGAYRIYFYDSNNDFISRTDGEDYVTHRQFTTVEGTSYIAIQYKITATTPDWDTVIINEGTTPAPYTPYDEYDGTWH